MFTKLFDQYFQWWQYASTRYFKWLTCQPFFLWGSGHSMERYLESKKMIDRMLEEMWRQLRFPPLEEVSRIHKRLNLLESELLTLQKHSGLQEGAVPLEDLKSSKEER